jgi:hypothetical protein
MTTRTAKDVETEEERQRLAEELTTENGPAWREEYRPGSFGCHELLDRTSLGVDWIERFILSHPACVQNAEWYALAEQAAAALRELYQRIGAEHLGPTGDARS